MHSHRFQLPMGIVAGASVAVLLVLWFPVLVGLMFDAFDDLYPVLTMRGRVVKVEADTVYVHIKGTKNRGTECKLARIYGYWIEADGTRHLATATRIDIPAVGATHLAGKHDIGVWAIRPVQPDAVSVRVLTEHNCVGRFMKTKIADVTL